MQIDQCALSQSTVLVKSLRKKTMQVATSLQENAVLEQKMEILFQLVESAWLTNARVIF